MLSLKKGFTLIEILVVVGILAVLATAVILVLNPADYLKQSRDSVRISDLQNINRALNLYSVSGGDSFGNPTKVYVSIPGPDDCSGLGLPDISGDPQRNTYECSSATDYKKNNGDGWIPVNFVSIPQGSPLSVLPVDPLNTVVGGHYYTYAVGSWEITAIMESDKYGIDGSSDVVTTDGGTSDARYEVGTELDLTPSAIEESRVGPDTAPGVPRNLAALPGNALVNLSWTAPSSNGGQPITHYVVYRSLDGSVYSAIDNSSACDAPSLTSCTDASLTNGQIYYYKVSAVNSIGEGPLTSAVSATPSSGMVGRYWVGGSGSWSQSSHWSDSSGGAGGASVPTSSDNVYINSQSGSSAVITIDANASVKSIDFTGAVSPQLDGSAQLNIGGSLKLVPSLTMNYTGLITFSSTQTNNEIWSAGKIFDSNITFNGVGGEWKLQDSFNNGSRLIILSAGSLDTNGQTVTTGGFYSGGTSTRSLTLGASSVNLFGYSGQVWSIENPNSFTLIANSSTIRFLNGGEDVYMGGKAYNAVVFESNIPGTSIINDSNTFNSLTLNSLGGTFKFEEGATQTINNAFTANGTSSQKIYLKLFPTQESAANKWTVESLGTESLSYLDIEDSVASPAVACNPSGTCTSPNQLGNVGWSY